MSTRIIHTILFLIFLSFSAVQYNDPDALGWMLIYFFVALPFLLNVIGIYRKSVVIGLCIVVFGMSLVYMPGFFDFLRAPGKRELFGEMTPDKMYLEETREFLGLLIAGFALIYLLKSGGKSKETI